MNLNTVLEVIERLHSIYTTKFQSGLISIFDIKCCSNRADLVPPTKAETRIRLNTIQSYHVQNPKEP